MNELTTAQQDRLDECELAITQHKDGFLAVAAALVEIRDDELWKPKYPNFNAYCKERWGWTGRRGNQIIQSAQTVNRLIQNRGTLVPGDGILQPLTPNPSHISEKAARALTKVGTEKENEIFNSASVNGEPPTAAAIKEAAKPKAAKPKPATPSVPAVVLDCTGYPIPEKRLALWNRRDEFEALYKPIGEVSSFIRRIMEAGATGNGDILFRDINASAMWSDLKLIYHSIKTAAPYAVCVDCQGQRSDTCMSCKGSGFVSKHTWDSVVNSDAKRLRELTVKSFAEKAT